MFREAAFLVVIAAVAPACVQCEPTPAMSVPEGNFVGGEPAVSGPGPFDAEHPHRLAFEAGATKTLNVDRATNTVTVKYELDGKTIVERWRIAD